MTTSPRRVTSASGGVRWACRTCSTSYPTEVEAQRCACHGAVVRPPSYMCDICATEYDTTAQAAFCAETCAKGAGDRQHVLEEAVTLGPVYNLAPDAVMEINPAAIARPEVPEPLAAELLGRAARHMHDRAATYDSPEGERSMGKAVAAFNAICGASLTEGEGWLFMALLKAVRAQTRSEPHQDSLEDLIAYAALYAEARGDGR